ncbi:TetR/AcrR family transcriptional regulator [Apilactobacillus apinorum]|uniref:TetR/AcrR family transcriptional regulator n=1 Tax=Apilactobacillus apinorum TaxID=1218495 RepID=UPI0030E8427A
MVKQDRRTIQTKAQITDALIQLIHEKGFNNLNVTDLTRAAGIGRGTFYIHYLDKFDLLNKIEAQLMDEIQQVLNNVIPEELSVHSNADSEVPSELLIKTLDYFYQNSKLLSALLSPDGDPYLIDKIKDMFRNLIKESFHASSDDIEFNPNIPRDYIMEIILDRLMSIVVYWMSKEDLESPEEIAKIIKLTQHVSPNELVYIKK